MRWIGAVGLVAIAAGCGGVCAPNEAPSMKLEHVAFMTQDPAAAAKWYVEHLGMKIVRSLGQSPFTHFLADSSGTVLFEIYNNPKAKVPDYASQDTLVFHLAFVSDDVRRDRDRLIRAGATLAADVPNVSVPGEDEVVTLRDPWGVPIQVAKRVRPMLRQ